MTSYLLDTNHASAMIKKNAKILNKVGTLPFDSTLGISIPSIAELWFMVFNSVKIEQNTKDLNEVLAGLVRFDFIEDAAIEFGRVKTELRKMGRPIPDPDSQIAAIAKVNGLIVLTADAHFNNVSGLQCENWLI